MSFSLFFKRGDLKGTGYPLGNGAIVVGRSSKDTDLTVGREDDSISRRHFEIRVADGKVFLTNIASLDGTTKVNGVAISRNIAVELKPGAEVELGSNGGVVFVLREDEVSPYSWQERTTQSVRASATRATMEATDDTQDDGEPPPRDKTEADPYSEKLDEVEQLKYHEPTDAGGYDDTGESTGSGTGSCGTIDIKTPIPGEGDFDALIKEEKRRRMLKRIKNFCVFLGVFAAIATVYFMMRPRPEAELSWPKDAAGDWDIAEISLDTPFGSDDFWLRVPNDAHLTKSVSDDGTVKVETRLGANRDVPFYVEFFCRRDPSFATMSRDDLLAQEFLRLQSSGKWNFQAKSALAFIGKDNGLPYFNVQYQRSVKTPDGDEQRYGQMFFATYADAIFVLFREIPAYEQWRGASVLAANAIFCISSDAQLARWEGGTGWRNSPVESLMAEANGLLSLKSPRMWKDVEYLLQSALIVSTLAISRGSGNVDGYQRIIERLKQLRLDEKKEFNRLRISWESHNRLGEKEGCRADMGEALRIFSMPDDARNARLQKGEWQ